VSLLVVGSIAFDSIKTPREEVRDILGGSAVYFSLAARLMGPVRLVGVVGEDFPPEHLAMLAGKGIDTAGVEVAEGKTFRWSGEYFGALNRRETLSVELNVFARFQPKIPPAFRDSEFVFLANGAPMTQLSVLEQVKKPRFVMADTMDLWIKTAREDLGRLLRRIDGLVINDDEALLLTEARNLIEAGKAILELGPKRVVIKKGEHGALLFTADRVVPLPAFPIHDVRDPTGAGDSFAGGLMGRLASEGSVGEAEFKNALASATVMASFTVEDFGVRRLLEISPDELESRIDEYCSLLSVRRPKR
jgi:sugar/nucleoside kinase (ribokinase family)